MKLKEYTKYIHAATVEITNILDEKKIILEV